PKDKDKLPIFSTGMIGQYVHGNEPSHHVAYLYNYAGKPWKTQEKVRKIMKTKYKNSPDGLAGNEDCGQIASWYVFSALGFYPVNPASGKYVIGSPVVNQATIKVSENKTFRIIAKNNSPENIYIQKVSLNGKPLQRSYLEHKEIMDGGTLKFQMGPKPNKNWATEVENLPKSKTSITHK
ncbi:MAG TPA: glycoside hydrolase domain-containing protein, partial [bacterium]|nr:glycoside hydrolase domain-containing protein [bacterium]